MRFNGLRPKRGRIRFKRRNRRRGRKRIKRLRYYRNSRGGIRL